MKRSKVRSASSRLRVARPRRLDDLVAGVAERAAERLENLLFVVDEKNGAVMGPACVRLLPRRSRRI